METCTMNERKASLLRSSFAIGLALVLGAGTAAAAEFDIIYGSVTSGTAPQDTCVKVFKSYVEQASRGRIEVRHFPGQLGNFRELIEQVQLGSIQMLSTTSGGISTLFPEIQALEIPYLIENIRIVEKVADDRELVDKLRKDALEATGSMRLLGLTGGQGFRSFWLREGPAKTASDLKGIAIRTVEAPIAMEFAASLGMNPTPIPWGELYTSLATGLVAAINNSEIDTMSMSFDDFLKWNLQDKHTFTYFFWWVNDPWLQSLPPDLQKVIADGFDRAKTACWGIFDVLALEWSERLARKGVQIYVPTEEEKATFLGAQKAVESWLISNFGDDYPTAVRATVKRAEEAIAAEDAAILGE